MCGTSFRYRHPVVSLTQLVFQVPRSKTLKLSLNVFIVSYSMINPPLNPICLASTLLVCPSPLHHYNQPWSGSLALLLALVLLTGFHACIVVPTLFNLVVPIAIT